MDIECPSQVLCLVLGACETFQRWALGRGHHSAHFWPVFPLLGQPEYKESVLCHGTLHLQTVSQNKFFSFLSCFLSGIWPEQQVITTKRDIDSVTGKILQGIQSSVATKVTWRSMFIPETEVSHFLLPTSYLLAKGNQAQDHKKIREKRLQHLCEAWHVP